MQPLSATMPVMVCPGNHELEPLFTAYNARFASMPGATPQGYSWEEGPVHMIQLNSFGDYAKGSVQYNWLVADLAAITPKTPWVLVQLHAPWYNSNTHHTNDGQLMRVTIESLLDAAHVAVVFAGHVHAYERSVPSVNLKPDASGPVYITIGDGGNREGLYNGWITPTPAWSAYHAAEYGHGEMNIVNATHAFWAWVRNADAEPTATDSAWIVNPRSA